MVAFTKSHPSYRLLLMREWGLPEDFLLSRELMGVRRGRGPLVGTLFSLGVTMFSRQKMLHEHARKMLRLPLPCPLESPECLFEGI